MPRQNRITPSGENISSPGRGTFMGNRGNLHDAAGTIRRQWKLKAWITCLLEFKGRKRPIMSPGKYTELFFLDEATALAAGHRPCAECRRSQFIRFKELWLHGNENLLPASDIRIGQIDEIVHRERIDQNGAKVIFSEKLSQIPDGVFMRLREQQENYLVWNDHLMEWSPFGYRSKTRLGKDLEVEVLTPKSIFQVIASGYFPQVHDSVNQFI